MCKVHETVLRPVGEVRFIDVNYGNAGIFKHDVKLAVEDTRDHVPGAVDALDDPARTRPGRRGSGSQGRTGKGAAGRWRDASAQVHRLRGH